MLTACGYGVRQQGDWEAWIEFFLAGVESKGLGRGGHGPAIAGAVPCRCTELPHGREGESRLLRVESCIYRTGIP